MREFYESVWNGLPRDPQPWAWTRRRAILLRELRPGDRVLDVGCGAGRFIAAAHEAGADVIGGGIAGGGLGRGRPGAPGAGPRPPAADGRPPPRHGEGDLLWGSGGVGDGPPTRRLLPG